MAIDITVTDTVVRQQRRTSTTVINSPAGGDYTLSAVRDLVSYDANNVIVSTSRVNKTVVRFLSRLTNEPPFVCADGTSVTIAHMIEVVSGLIDRWDEEDMTNPAAPIITNNATPVAPPPPPPPSV